MDRIWLKHYSAGVPADIDPSRYANLIDLIETAFKTHAAKPAYKMMGATKTFAQIDEASRALAAYFQGLGSPRATAWPS
jgi:long-chain acyl-CoA synthetase